MYSAVLFDWDGCLAHSLPIWTTIFQKILKEDHGIEVSQETILNEYFKKQNRIEVEYQLDSEAFFERALEEMYLVEHTVLLQDYAEEMLKTLKKSKKKIALVTSSSKPVIHRVLPILGIKHLFDAIYCWEDTDKNKPDPEPLFAAMRDIGAKPSQTIMIGDTDADILGAKNAGVASAWYYSKENEEIYDEDQYAHLNPDYVVRHFKELLEIVL